MIDNKKIRKWIISPCKPIINNGANTDDIHELQDVMTKYGMKESKFYNRVKYVGFDEWEMDGIDNCIISYQKLIESEGCTSDDDRLSPKKFRQILSAHGLLTDFYNFMQKKGMSQKTTSTRFAADDFELWERFGVKSLMNQCTDTPIN